MEYEALAASDSKWCCLKCINGTIPFSGLSNEMLKLTNQGMNVNPLMFDLDENLNIEFFQDIEDKLLDPDSETNHLDDCPYFTLNSDLNKLKTNPNSISYFHLNIAS